MRAYLYDYVTEQGPYKYKSRYIVGFELVEMAISKPTIYRNLYENTGSGTRTSLDYVNTLRGIQDIIQIIRSHSILILTPQYSKLDNISSPWIWKGVSANL